MKELINYKDIKINGFFVPYSKWETRVEEDSKNEFCLEDLFYAISRTGKKEAELKIKHLECGNSFMRKGALWVGNKTCPVCSMQLTVSYLHAVFSIIFNHEYKNVENEKDIGFRGINGGVCKYDLYIPNLNGKDTLFEFQSRFHDNKATHDKNKKEYAEALGYNVIQIDHRKINLLEELKLYFPTCLEIPNYVFSELDTFKKASLVGVQELISKNYTVSDISKTLSIPIHIIHKGLCNGLLIPNEDRKEALYGKKSIVVLYYGGEYFRSFDSRYDAQQTINIKIPKIFANSATYCKGYFVVFKEDYDSGKYIIPKEIKKHILKIYKYTHS